MLGTATGVNPAKGCRQLPVEVSVCWEQGGGSTVPNLIYSARANEWQVRLQQNPGSKPRGGAIEGNRVKDQEGRGTDATEVPPSREMLILRQSHANDIEIMPQGAQEETPRSTSTRSPASRISGSGLSGDLTGPSLPHFLVVRERHSWLPKGGGQKPGRGPGGDF